MHSTLRIAAASLVLLVALAGCAATAAAPDGVASLASDNPNASAAPSASLSPEDSALAFTECMREHGIDMPDANVQTGPDGGVAFTFGGPDGDPSGGSRDMADGEAFEDAMDACDEFLQRASGTRGELEPEMLDRMVEFAQCMREHGIDMPDPNADGGIMIQRNDDGSATNGNGANIDPESDAFQEAQEACQPILGEDFGPRTNSSGPGGGDGPSVQSAPDEAKP
jgi:hypothetical protein